MTAFMEALASWLSVKVTLTLLHSLWQAALLAGALYVFLRLVPARMANVRYVVSFGALAVVLICALVTYNLLERSESLGQESPARAAMSREAATSTDTSHTTAVVGEASGRSVEPHATPSDSSAAGADQVTSIRVAFSRWVSRWSSWLAAIWFAGVIIMLARSAVSLSGASRLRSAARPCRNAAVLRVLEEVRSALAATRRVRLAMCARVKSPAALGILRPVILVPAVVVTGMSPEQLRVVLAHELAHVRRYDYLANLFQVVMEALFFFNPALWWMTRQVRIEREACCDAAAVSLTGRAESVAETLADWAAHIASRNREPVLGFAGQRHNALLERLRRLAFPSGRPSLRLPWYSVAAVLVSSALVLAALGSGAGLAVYAAEKLFTHEERIEKLTEVKAEYGDERAPDSIVGYDALISGVVRTFDGKPLPEKGYFTITSAVRGSASTIAGLSFGADGRFERKCASGQVSIAAQAPGYAPAFAGPFHVRSGETLKDVEIVLGEGFPVRIKVVDEDGKPIADAEIKGSYTQPFSSNIAPFASDADGLAVIEHCAAGSATFQTTVDGFQYDRIEMDLTPGAVHEWRLGRAEPATGVVVSKETGKPIPTAEVWFYEAAGPGAPRMAGEPRSWGQPTAFADSEGRFSLLSLRDECAYTFFVYAVGYAPVFIENVRAGRRELEVDLGPELYVRGTIIAPGQLGDKGRWRVHYDQPVRIGDSGNSWQHSVSVTLDGDVGRFTIWNLWAGPLNIDVGKQRVTLDLTAPVEDLVIDLTPPAETEAAEVAKRRVEMHFLAPEGAPPVEGSAKITFTSRGADNRTTTHIPNQEMPIVDGVISFEVPVPGSLNWWSGKTPGYCGSRSGVRPVPVGEGPFVIEIKCVPAGAIYGRVFEANGSPASLVGPGSASLSILTVSAAENQSRGRLSLAVESQPDGKYMATPLPLGGSYAVVAHRGASYAMSEPIWLDDAIPVGEVDIHLVEGVPIEVQVLEPDGTPAAGVPLKFEYSTPYGSGYGGTPQDTDRSGRLVLEQVNPDAPGAYYLRMASRLKYRPVFLPLDAKGGPATIQLELGKVVTGRVVDNATGRPVKDVKVYTIDHEEKPPLILEMEQETTGEDGTFRFSNMAAREYQLNVRDGRTVGECKVTGGQSEPVEIRFTPYELAR